MLDYDVLNFAISEGIIDLPTVCAEVETMKKNQILKAHNYKVWQGKNGKWFTYLDVGGKRRLVKRKTKEEVNQAILDYYSIDTDPTIHDVFLQWVTEKLKYGEIQRQSYDRYINDYKRFLSVFGRRRIKDVTEDDLYDFIRRTIHDKELTAKAWSGLRTLLIGTFKYAKRKHYTDFSISLFMGDLDISKGAYKKRRFTDEESVFTDGEVNLIKAEIAKEPPSISSFN